MQEGAWSLYISFQNRNTQEGTGEDIYKPSVLDEKQVCLNRIDREAIKVLSSLRLTTLQHVSLLTETKGNCAHVLLLTACLSEMSTGINCLVCELKKPMPSDSRSSTAKDL